MAVFLLIIAWNLICNSDIFAQSFIISVAEKENLATAELAKEILYKKFNIPSQLIEIRPGSCVAYKESAMSICAKEEHIEISFLNKRKIRNSFLHLIKMQNENDGGEK